MKHQTKLSAMLAAAVLAAGSTAALPGAPVQAAASYQNIVILGDSISSGYALGAGEAGYYDIIADCTGGTVTNYAVAGHTSSDLLKVLADSSKQAAIKDADLICISIGGNDLMQPARAVIEKKMQEGETLIDTVKRIAKSGGATDLIPELTKATRSVRNGAEEMYQSVETAVRGLNPNAEVIMQTLYNPFEISPEMIAAQNLSEKNQKDYNSLLNYVSGTESALNTAMKKLETVDIADVSEVFKNTGWLYTRFTSEDNRGDIHPNALGHALIAAEIMDTLGDVSGRSEKIEPVLMDMQYTDYAAVPKEDLTQMRKYASPFALRLGDADESGDVSSADAQKTLIWYVSSLAGKTPAKKQRTFVASDVDGDKEITAKDAQYILQYYVSVLAQKTPNWSDIIKH
ncbi:MAG: hypothetical protein IKQ39_00850 [Oscillospiraceae bacterium]|nr:hypothetical protein [Oscillospiraceae bacterium]